MIDFVNDIFETTKQGIREILESDMLKNIKKFVYKETEYAMEQEDIAEMLKNLQGINLGIIDKVTVKDINGNEIEMNKDEYVQRNLVGFKNRTSEQFDLDFLNKIVDGIQTFTEFVNFKDLATAKAFYMPKVEEQPKEPVYEGDIYPLPQEPEIVEGEVDYDTPPHIEEEQPVEEQETVVTEEEIITE